MERQFRVGWGNHMTPSPLPHRPQTENCNLRRSANLGSNVQGSIADSSPVCLLGALHRTDLLLLTLRRGASIIIPSLGLPWVAINHAHLNLSAWPRSFLFHRIHNDRRKRFSVYPPPGAPSPDYGALTAAYSLLPPFFPAQSLASHRELQ